MFWIRDCGGILVATRFGFGFVAETCAPMVVRIFECAEICALIYIILEAINTPVIFESPLDLIILSLG